ncbi:MAG TPA: FxsA family protein [Pilimelia sp.]|nr:FxsA family protein [Pilimelia sp.]
MRRGVLLVPVALALAGAVEVVVFILVTRWLGLPAAMLLFLAMSVLGVVLLRREGVRAWRRFRAAAEAGQPPGVRVADGLVGLVGALLLAVPGFVSGVLGLGLLLPPSRSLARRAVQRVAERRMPSMVAGDVFGPRRVRVRRGPAQPASPPPAAEPAGGDAARPAIEGEIVGPEDQSGPPPRH